MKATILTLILFFSSFFALSQEITAEAQRILQLVEQSDDQVYDNPSQSLTFALEAYQLATSLQNDSLLAVTLNRIGSAHWSLGNEKEALEKIQESLQIAETRGYRQLMANNYGNLGNVYSASGLDLDAIAYYKSELEIQKSLNVPFRLFVINNNIGKAYLDIDHYDSADHYLERASNYLNDNFIQLHSIFYFNLAESYFKQNNLDVADSLLEVTLKNAKQFDSKRGLIRANQLKAELELKRKNYDVAFDHALLATNMAMESNVKELIYLTNKTLSKCYASLNEFKKAYLHNSIYESYLDSVQNVAIVNELELLTYYQRLFRMRVLEERNILNKQVAEQRRFIIYGLIAVLIIALFMISIIIRRGIKIRVQKKKLEVLDAFKTKVFAIVSHDLKSPIQSVSSALELFQEKLISKEEIEKHLPEIRAKTSGLLELLNNIFQWAEGQMIGEELKKEDFALVEVIRELEAELADRLEAKSIKLVYDKESELMLFSSPSIVRIVLRNLFVNAIKFSHKNSTVSVNATVMDGKKIIEVHDEGIGINPSMLHRLFSMEVGSSKGTEGERGNGLGLALCFDFVRGLGGTIEVESELDQGSVFRVLFSDQHE